MHLYHQGTIVAFGPCRGSADADAEVATRQHLTSAAKLDECRRELRAAREARGTDAKDAAAKEARSQAQLALAAQELDSLRSELQAARHLHLISP